MLQTQPEVHRGGTVYFPPYLQQPSTRSPARRQKVAIPIVDPLVRVAICHLFVCLSFLCTAFAILLNLWWSGTLLPDGMLTKWLYTNGFSNKVHCVCVYTKGCVGGSGSAGDKACLCTFRGGGVGLFFLLLLPCVVKHHMLVWGGGV